jgi:heptose-I-phosphate ethanolaminephosphotransferase
MADVVSMENNKPGRSSNSLDEILLPSYENALKDSHPRKLIVLHMLGLILIIVCDTRKAAYIFR